MYYRRIWGLTILQAAYRGCILHTANYPNLTNHRQPYVVNSLLSTYFSHVIIHTTYTFINIIIAINNIFSTASTTARKAIHARGCIKISPSFYGELPKFYKCFIQFRIFRIENLKNSRYSLISELARHVVNIRELLNSSCLPVFSKNVPNVAPLWKNI